MSMQTRVLVLIGTLLSGAACTSSTPSLRAHATNGSPRSAAQPAPSGGVTHLEFGSPVRLVNREAMVVAGYYNVSEVPGLSGLWFVALSVSETQAIIARFDDKEMSSAEFARMVDRWLSHGHWVPMHRATKSSLGSTVADGETWTFPGLALEATLTHGFGPLLFRKQGPPDPDDHLGQTPIWLIEGKCRFERYGLGELAYDPESHIAWIELKPASPSGCRRGPFEFLHAFYLWSPGRYDYFFETGLPGRRM